MYSPTRRDLLAGSALLFARRLRALPLADLKLGITTDEIDDDVLTAAKFLQQYNLHWAEIRNIWGPYNTAQPMEKIREAAKILDEHGIHVSIEGTGFFKIPLPPDTPEGQKKLDAQWALLNTAMERAKAFGTDKIRIFTFMLGKERDQERKGLRPHLGTDARSRAPRQGLPPRGGEHRRRLCLHRRGVGDAVQEREGR